MLRVKSLIEKEMKLEDAVEENNQALVEFMSILQEITKKKADDIRFSLCGEHG